MAHKWTTEDHQLVKKLTGQGLTVIQISEVTGLSVGGIKRSRTVNQISGYPDSETDNRINGEPDNRLSDPKLQITDTSELTDQINTLTDRIAALEGQVDKLVDTLMEVKVWIDKKKKEEQKAAEAREYEASQQPGYDPDKPSIVFGKKQ